MVVRSLTHSFRASLLLLGLLLTQVSDHLATTALAQPISALSCRPGDAMDVCEKAILAGSPIRQRSRGPATEARVFETVYLATGFLAFPSAVERTELKPQSHAADLEFVLVMPSTGELWLLVGLSGQLQTVYRKTPVPVDQAVGGSGLNPHVQDRLNPFLTLRSDFKARCSAKPSPIEQKNVFRLEGRCGPWATVFEYKPETDSIWWKYTP